MRAGVGLDEIIKHMKTKIILLTSLISAGLLLGTTAYARGGNGNGGGGGRGSCGGAPACDGSGQSVNPNCGNPNSNGTPLKDGSGKATAPGRGAKDGTGNRANCPIPPKA